MRAKLLLATLPLMMASCGNGVSSDVKTQITKHILSYYGSVENASVRELEINYSHSPKDNYNVYIAHYTWGATNIMVSGIPRDVIQVGSASYVFQMNPLEIVNWCYR